MAPYYVLVVGADEERVLRCRLMADDEIVTEPFAERNFGGIIQKRLKEADEFYDVAIPCKFFFVVKSTLDIPPTKAARIKRLMTFGIEFHTMRPLYLALFLYA